MCSCIVLLHERDLTYTGWDYKTKLLEYLLNCFCMRRWGGNYTVDFHQIRYNHKSTGPVWMHENVFWKFWISISFLAKTIKKLVYFLTALTILYIVGSKVAQETRTPWCKLHFSKNSRSIFIRMKMNKQLFYFLTRLYYCIIIKNTAFAVLVELSVLGSRNEGGFYYMDM